MRHATECNSFGGLFHAHTPAAQRAGLALALSFDGAELAGAITMRSATPSPCASPRWRLETPAFFVHVRSSGTSAPRIASSPRGRRARQRRASHDTRLAGGGAFRHRARSGAVTPRRAGLRDGALFDAAVRCGRYSRYGLRLFHRALGRAGRVKGAGVRRPLGCRACRHRDRDDQHVRVAAARSAIGQVRRPDTRQNATTDVVNGGVSVVHLCALDREHLASVTIQNPRCPLLQPYFQARILTHLGTFLAAWRRALPPQ